MSSLRRSVAFLAWFALLALSFGFLQGDKIHRNRTPKSIARSVEKRQAPVSDGTNGTSTDGFRFLTNKTAPFQVQSLPDVPFDLGEMYSGLVPIDNNDTSRALFYVFQPTTGAPVDEVTIWLNGGPGCSSLEGFFQENGKFLWQPGQFAPELNPYTWVNLTNMLWVDQPVGTGFSIGEIRAVNELDVAQDFIGFFKNWEELFGISNFKIFVTGESYAGRYVPYISAAMIDQNDTEFFNLSGALAYDPVIGSYDYSQEEAVALPFLLENQAIIGLNDSFVAEMIALDEQCGFAAYRETFMTFPPAGLQPANDSFFNYTSEADCDIWDDIFFAALAVNPCFNIYHITDSCPLLPDVLGFPGSLEVITPGLPIYFDRADVKQAIHAPNISWSECSEESVFVGSFGADDNFSADESPDPIQGVLPQVIEHTNRVLVSNGDLDYIIITNGTLLAIQNMTWNGALGFQEMPTTPTVIEESDIQYAAEFDENGLGGVDGPQGTMGINHFERGLMWAETFQSGHMQPQYQPRSSLKHLEWVLGRIDTL